MRWSPKPCGSIDRACGHARRGVGGGMVPFSFTGEDFLIMGQGALFWPARKALLIADLHLEKASFFARFGQMLPPYDSNATLAAIERSEARRVGKECVSQCRYWWSPYN